MAEIVFTQAEKNDIKRIAEQKFDWRQLKGSTVLISGGSGFIGSYIIAVLEERNRSFKDNIRIISISRHKHDDRKNVTNVIADITDDIDLDGKIDYIIHLASNTHPKQYSEDPVGTVTTNILGCNNLLRLAVRKNARRFLLASSVEIYGNGSNIPMAEDYCGYINCNTARAGYNESKRVSESLCQSYYEQYGVGNVIARLARVFGADRKKDTKAMAQFIEKAVNGENIILKSYGNQRFSYCYVTDAVSAILKLLMDGKNGEAYNISDDDEGFTLGDYAKIIAEHVGKNVEFNLDDKQVGASTVQYALLNCNKIKSIGWQPFYTVTEGIKTTIDIKKRLQCD